MQVQPYGIRACQGGTGISQSAQRLNENMPGKSLQDSLSLKARRFPCGTLACDF